LYATTRWPPRKRRSTMLAPMRPRPTKPMSMIDPLGGGNGGFEFSDDGGQIARRVF
jgi:hypothetical protein